MNKRALATIGVATMIALAIPGIAHGHNASATPSCSGLTWSAVNYNKDVTNSIVVKVDGVTVHSDADFKASDTGILPWSQTAAHTWSVVVNAPGSEFDKSFSGTWQPCQTTTTVATTVPTSTTVVVTTTVPPTTSVPDVATTVVTDPATTTTQVAVCCPPVPTTLALIDVVDVVQEPVLPRTGGALDLLMVAALLVFAGFVVMVTRRRVG